MNAGDRHAPGSQDPSLPSATPGGSASSATAAPPVSRERPPESGPKDFLPWPPPGLERLQGDLWMVIRQISLGGAVLVIPLLVAVATEQEFWSLGPFGENWWILLLTSLVGLGGIVEGFVGLFRIMRRASSATSRGYGWITVVEVLTDHRRDNGFLLQGARIYSVLDPGARRRLLVGRLLSAGAIFLGVLWLPVGFALAVLLAARGVFGAGGVWVFTLGPSVFFLLVGALARVFDVFTVRAAKKRYYAQPWRQDLAGDQVGEWNERMRARQGPGALGTGGPLRRTLKAGAAVVVLLAVLVIVPALTLMFTAALAPTVASISIPKLAGAQQRAAGVYPLRAYRVDPDPSVSAVQAGQALHALTFVGTGRPPEALELPPVREYERPFFPDSRGGATGIFPGQWAERLLPRIAERGLGDAERAYLAEVAAHPALSELATLARARSIDVVSTRWTTPLPDSVALLALPVPRFGPVREAAFAQIGRAGLEMSEGRIDDAERSLREVLSAGLLLADEAPMLIDNLVGIVIAEQAATALVGLYGASGREREAEQLEASQDASQRAAELASLGRSGDELQGSLREMTLMVEEDGVLRGLRWEYFATFNTLAPCLNTHKIVFGPDADYRSWVERARPHLVRFEGEEALYQRARSGWLGTGGEGPRARGGWVEALLGLTVGGEGARGSCGALFEGLSAAQMIAVE